MDKEFEKEKEIKLTGKDEIKQSADSGSGDEGSIDLIDLGERFTALECIGAGAMGKVYKATDNRVGKTVAVKVLKSDLSSDPVAIKRFEHEVDAASKLDHPSMVPVYMHSRTPSGRPFLTMEYIEGQNLAQLIKSEEKLDQKRALRIFIEIAEALSHAHKREVIHRDLKPSNVVIQGEGNTPQRARVLDFGIAKVLSAQASETAALTKTGDIVGSPFYMSPEQCQGQELDVRSDIYSMGCLMVEALTGKPPYEGAHSVQIILNHINEPVFNVTKKLKSAGVSKDLNRIITACLKKDPRQRYESTTDLMADLKSLLKEQKPQNIEKVEKKSKNPYTIAFAVAASVVLTVFVLYWGAFNNNHKVPLGPFNQFRLSHIKSNYITDNDLFKATNADKRVTYMDLKNSQVTDNGLKYLAEFKRMRSLSVQNCRITDRGLDFIKGYTNIDWLNLEDTKITDKGIDKLRSLTRLRSLYLKGTAIGDDSMKPLSDLPMLSTLCLTRTQVSDQGLSELNNLALKRIHFVSDRISDKGIQHLARLVNLESLQLNKTQITDKGLEYLAELPKLNSLNISSTDITDNGAQFLARMKKLRRLRAGYTKISNESLSYLSGLGDLAYLYLDATNISDKNIEALLKIEKLRTLDLSQTNITDKSIKVISRLPNIERLIISNTNVTDEGILALADCKRLLHLNLSGCKQVTGSGIRELKNKNPNIDVK